MLGIYTRISKDRKNQISTEVQKQGGIECAKKLKLKHKLYPEKKGTSGGLKIEDRPQLKKLVDDCINGTITHIYVYNQDRAERNELTWFTLVDMMEQYNIKLYENGTHIDFDDENVRILTGMKAIMNASFKRTTAKKVADALKKKVAQGKATNPVVKYGFYKDKDGYIRVDDKGQDGYQPEAEIVKRMYKLSLEGKGTTTIANILNEEGIPTRYAKTAKGTLTITNKLSGRVTTKKKKEVQWSQNTVLQILKSTWNYGKRKYKGKYYDIPAIISKEYWDKVNDNLKKNRRHSGKSKNDYLLRDVIRCECGRNMYGIHYEPKKEFYYKCNSNRTKGRSCGTRSINRPFLNDFIWKRFFLEMHLINRIKEHFQNTDEKKMIEQLHKELQKTQKAIEQIKGEKTNTIRLHSKNVITDDEVEVELTRIRTELTDAENKALELQAQIKTYKDVSKSGGDLIEEIQTLMKKTGKKDKKQIINKYIQDIIVGSSMLKITGHYDVTVNFKIPNLEPEHYLVDVRRKYGVEPDKEILIHMTDDTFGFTPDRHFIKQISYAFREYVRPKRTA